MQPFASDAEGLGGCRLVVAVVAQGIDQNVALDLVDHLAQSALGVVSLGQDAFDLAHARAFYVDYFGCEVLLDTPRLVALNVAGRSVLLLFPRGATEVPRLYKLFV